MDNHELDAIRQRLIDSDPGLRQDIARMTDLFRELVNLERRKMGLDRPGGRLWLRKNTEKKDGGDPDLIGDAIVAGRSYRAAGWLNGAGKLKISLLVQRRKND